jgi:hypothetical protein
VEVAGPAAMGDTVEEADLADPNPDVQDLFKHYDRLYFRDALVGAGFVVKWGSPPGSRLGFSRSWLPPTCGRSLGCWFACSKPPHVTPLGAGFPWPVLLQHCWGALFSDYISRDFRVLGVIIFWAGEILGAFGYSAFPMLRPRHFFSFG